MIHDTAVLIGRFQPLHDGHVGLLRVALQTAPRVVVVLGSAFSAPTPRNPFSASQREAMLRSIPGVDGDRLRFHFQRDVWNGAEWAMEVETAVHRIAPGRTALVGYQKDSSSEYLGTFPKWDLVDAGRQGSLDATPLRERILSEDPWEQVRTELVGKVPEGALPLLDAWANSPVRTELAADLKAIREYQARWGKGPFLTVDAVVQVLDHVLLIRRGARPGRGLVALPGGFLEPEETFEQGARRELHEETQLDLAEIPVVGSAQFAHPGRSLRARIVTQVSLFRPDWTSLPSVRGSDDALEARWVRCAELPNMEDRFFGDHFHILRTMIGFSPRSGSPDI